MTFGNVARNHQVLGGVPKAKVCLDIAEVCGENVSDADYQAIVEKAAQILKEEYPNLTIRKLDGVIWRDFSGRGR